MDHRSTAMWLANHHLSRNISIVRIRQMLNQLCVQLLSTRGLQSWGGHVHVRDSTEPGLHLL